MNDGKTAILERLESMNIGNSEYRISISSNSISNPQRAAASSLHNLNAVIFGLRQPIWRSATQLSELHDHLKGKHTTTLLLLPTNLLEYLCIQPRYH